MFPISLQLHYIFQLLFSEDHRETLSTGRIQGKGERVKSEKKVKKEMSGGREGATKEARDKRAERMEKESGFTYIFLFVLILSLDKRKLFDLSRKHPHEKLGEARFISKWFTAEKHIKKSIQL